MTSVGEDLSKEEDSKEEFFKNASQACIKL